MARPAPIAWSSALPALELFVCCGWRDRVACFNSPCETSPREYLCFMAWVREAWGLTLALGSLLGVASAGGCSDGVESGPESDAAAGSSGSAGSGGNSGSAGRGGSGGSAGSGGSSGRGGASGSGGGGFDNCTPVMGESVCIACARRNCCAELLACGREQPCVRGSTGTNGELSCIRTCVATAVSDGGVADDDTFRQCAGNCAVGSTISPATNELFACLINGERTDGAIGTDCVVECFDGG